MRSILNTSKNIHFIGIGGIGISAIARMMLADGKKVSGSDASGSEIIDSLKKLGAEIKIGHNTENLPKDTDLVIYTVAISKENPEFIEAGKRKIKMLTYAEALHEISKDKFTIAVSGTHGKTTTTAMIAKVLIDAGLDPTVIVGSLIKSDEKSGFATNFIAGRSKYFVVEACEYKRSFLNIEPTIVAITNIDNDHLDYYKDIKDIQSAFNKFAKKAPEKGFVICNIKDKNISGATAGISAKIVNWADFKADKLRLKVPGEHNKKDASVALAVAHLLGIDKKKAEKSLEGFVGTWRRFEYKGETKSGVIVYEDYAHHPTEIKATLKGAREMFPKQKIVVVFQPHLFSRTKLLLRDFGKAFSDADEILLAPIYPAREAFDPTISSEILAEEINKNKKTAQSFTSFEDIEKELINKLKKGDILITMGAGEAYKIGEEIIK
ncbi:MAG: UDP-N-acetylmuramate--L-alanine ligase [Candidatus Paceibacterota bacterium]|jgi:UDP-N-acetylmuramate--alanine ligase